MKRLAWLVLVVCGSSSSASPPRQLRTPWERPVDGAKLATAAKASKALRCLDSDSPGGLAPASHRDFPPAVVGALLEADAVLHPDKLDAYFLVAVGAGALDSGRRLLAVARAHHVEVQDYVVDALEGKGPSPSRDDNSIVTLVRAGRLDDARAAYAAVESNGGWSKNAESSTAYMLGALGRTDEGLKFTAAKPRDDRSVLDRNLLDGALASASPVDAVDRVVAALVRDSAGDATKEILALADAASMIRSRGFGDHAWVIRHSLATLIQRTGDVISLGLSLAPEVLAVGSDDERRELHRLAVKLGADEQLLMRWARAYYRGTVAQALAVIRPHEFTGDRTDDLYMLWARAAVEGFDPATMKAIDMLACAPP